MGSLLKNPQLYADIILSSQENINLIREYHHHSLGGSYSLIRYHTKDEFIGSFNNEVIGSVIMLHNL